MRVRLPDEAPLPDYRVVPEITPFITDHNEYGFSKANIGPGFTVSTDSIDKSIGTYGQAPQKEGENPANNKEGELVVLRAVPAFAEVTPVVYTNPDAKKDSAIYNEGFCEENIQADKEKGLVFISNKLYLMRPYNPWGALARFVTLNLSDHEDGKTIGQLKKEMVREIEVTDGGIFNQPERPYNHPKKILLDHEPTEVGIFIELDEKGKEAPHSSLRAPQYDSETVLRLGSLIVDPVYEASNGFVDFSKMQMSVTTDAPRDENSTTAGIVFIASGNLEYVSHEVKKEPKSMVLRIRDRDNRAG